MVVWLCYLASGRKKLHFFAAFGEALKWDFLIKLLWHIQPWNTGLWRRQLGQREWVTDWIHITSHPTWERAALQRNWRRAKGFCSKLVLKSPSYIKIKRLMVLLIMLTCLIMYIRGMNGWQLISHGATWCWTEIKAFWSSDVLNCKHLWDPVYTWY